MSILKNNRINVARPSLPEKKEFLKHLNSLFKTHYLTTNGPLLKLLEKKLKKKLKVKHLLLVSNATVGLQIALKTFDPKKKIATTPFTYVSTYNAIKWIGKKEKFFDIKLTDLNIDEKKLDLKSLKDCSGILTTHSYGNPCNVVELEKISKKYNKFLIFDAAHCFNSVYKNKSLLSYGDASVISFQATKFFNTCEGGAIIFKKYRDYKIAKKLSQIGYDYNEKKNIPGEGTNGKMSELNAAWGLSLIKRIDEIFKKRRKVFNLYKKHLYKKVFIPLSPRNLNYLYIPIIFKSNKQLNECIKILNKKNIFPRRYFYPSLNLINSKSPSMKVSENVSKRILCLPMHEYLTINDIKKISLIVNLYFN